MSNSSDHSSRSPYRPPIKINKTKPPSHTCGVFIVQRNRGEEPPSVLLVHATHTHWRHWGIPKGLPEAGENWTQTACRELAEETDIQVSEERLQYIASIDYPKKSKTLHAFWVWADKIGLPSVSKMTCTSMVYHDPKFPGTFPEVDGYRWYPLDQAEKVLHEPQLKMLLLLKLKLDEK